MAGSNPRVRTAVSNGAIGQQRVQGGYVYLDHIRRVQIGAFCIAEAAEDTVNTDYRDEIMSALGKYGKHDSKCTVSGKISNAIACIIVNGRYCFVDRLRQRLIGWVCIVPTVGEAANTSLRNELLNAVYRYGKVLGLWP